MSYRNDVDALAARQAALAQEVATKTRELESASRLLDEAKRRAKLPVLPNIRVASPCSADWNQMTGDERVRACAACKKNVYNLSEMTRDEAEALILEKEGRLCVRYYQRKDGTILLKDCAIGTSQQRKRRLFAAGAAAMLAGGGLLAYKLTRPEPAPGVAVAPDHEELLGQAVVMPETLPPAHEIEEIKGKLAVPHDVEVLQGDVAFEPNEPID